MLLLSITPFRYKTYNQYETAIVLGKFASRKPFQPMREQNDHVVYSFSLCMGGRRGETIGKSFQRYIRILLSTRLANQKQADLFLHEVLQDCICTFRTAERTCMAELNERPSYNTHDLNVRKKSTKLLRDMCATRSVL